MNLESNPRFSMESSSGERVYSRNNFESKLLSAFNSSMDNLERIWQGFGINEEQSAERAGVVVDHITTLLGDLVKEETNLYESLKKKVLRYTEELKTLSKELDEEMQEPDKNLPLLQKEREFRRKLDYLEGEKYKRIRELKQLLKMESALCSLLDMPKSTPCKNAIPTKRELKELDENVRMMTDEKERRYEKYRIAKQELTTIMEETEFSPETSFEREIVCYENDDTFILSNKNLKHISELVLKFQKRKKEMEEGINKAREKMLALWSRLNIDEQERKDFLNRFSECRQSTLSAMKHEIERCEEIKRKNIGNYIIKLREELTSLWGKCYTSEEERQKFTAFNNTEFDEELLELHDKEVERMKNYYEQAKSILEKIEKRNVLWELMLKFEQKATDPNRFHNRGGNLLQEERERKRILKDLPRLEEEILQAIHEYEDINDETFLVNGVNFAEYIGKQWDNHMKEKENVKLERHKQRLLTGDKSTIMKTPSKRLLNMTPASAPCKLARTNLGITTSRLCNTRTRKPPAPYTPSDYAKKCSIINSPRKICKTPVRVLSQRNRIAPATQKKGHDETSYSQFAIELDKQSREYCRSSVRHSGKKVLGSKISHSGIMRKSMSGSTRSSMKSSSYSLRSKSKGNTLSFRNTSRTPTKITPARAKLGLPFLI